MNKDKDNTEHENEDVEMVKEVDEEALNTILRLYDKTIKDLVNR